MKFALIVAFGFILADCQHFYYYHPSPVINQLAYQYQQQQQARYFPMPWYRPAEEEDAVMIGGQDDHQQETRELLPEVASPRFLFGGLANNNNYLFALNTNFALKTQVYTTIKSKTVFTTALCLPSTGVVAGAKTCSRRRRHVDALLSNIEMHYNRFDDWITESLQPSPTIAVETTALPIDSRASTDDASAAISSSIGAHSDEETTTIGEQRHKRFFNAARYTYTSWKFTTSTVQQPLNIRFLQNYDPCPLNNNQPPDFVLYCVFDCIPPGYSLCTATP